MLTLAFAQIVWSIAFQWVAVTGGDNGILGVWPEKWAAGPAQLLLAVDRAWPRSRSRPCASSCSRRSATRCAPRATRCCAARPSASTRKRIQWTAFVIAGTVAGVAGALFAYLKGSVFPDSLGISLSVDALVMVLLGGVETVSGAVIGAIVYKALVDLAGQPDRPFETGARRRHRADRGRVSEGHRRHARDLPQPPPARTAKARAAEIRDRERRMSTAPTLLSVEGLSKSYGGVHAVRDVSFALQAGEILALIGPNGAGKSTCFDMLNGQTTPRRRPHQPARRRHHRQKAARDLAARRRPHLPDHRDLPDHDGARKRSGRAGVVWPAVVQSAGPRRRNSRATKPAACSNWSA